MQETQDLIQKQEERTERARAAILSGKFAVTRINPQQWTVKNGNKSPYVVTVKAARDDFERDEWACTCMDFQLHGPRMYCKHIEAVRLAETEFQTSERTEKENQMNDGITSTERSSEDRLESVLRQLRQPLDMSRVKRRQAPGMGSVPYLEGYDVINRANALFDFAWSFDLVGEPVIVRWQKKVMVWSQQEKRKVPLLDDKGNFQVEDVGIVYATGKVSITLNGQTYTHADLGRCVFTGDTPEALDMALAGSVTDCLKRCFRQLGDQFGNLLYDKEIAQFAGLETNPAAGNGAADHHPITNSSPHTFVRQYADGTGVNGNESEQEAFDAYRKKMGKPPASRNDLRNWVSANRVPTAA